MQDSNFNSNSSNNSSDRSKPHGLRKLIGKVFKGEKRRKRRNEETEDLERITAEEKRAAEAEGWIQYVPPAAKAEIPPAAKAVVEPKVEPVEPISIQVEDGDSVRKARQILGELPSSFQVPDAGAKPQRRLSRSKSMRIDGEGLTNGTVVEEHGERSNSGEVEKKKHATSPSMKITMADLINVARTGPVRKKPYSEESLSRPSAGASNFDGGGPRSPWGYNASRSLQHADVHGPARTERFLEAQRSNSSKSLITARGSLRDLAASVSGDEGDLPRRGELRRARSFNSGLTARHLEKLNDDSSRDLRPDRSPSGGSTSSAGRNLRGRLEPLDWIGPDQVRASGERFRMHRSLSSFKIGTGGSGMMADFLAAEEAERVKRPSPLQHPSEVHALPMPSPMQHNLPSDATQPPTPHQWPGALHGAGGSRENVLEWAYAPHYSSRTSPYQFLGAIISQKEAGGSGMGIVAACGGGSGFGSLWVSYDKEANTHYIAKVFDRRLLLEAESETRKKAIETINLERRLLSLRSPFLLSALAVMQDEVCLYFVLDYVGGEPLGVMLEKQGRLEEGPAAFFVGEVVEAISHLHERGIVYRSLSPESVLVDGTGHVRLTDFTASKENIWTPQTGCTTICGTDPFRAPEVIFGARGHGLAADWWGVGMVLYKLVTGKLPVSSVLLPDLEGDLEKTLDAMPAYVGPNAQSCIKELLNTDPRMRLGSSADGAQDVKHHILFAHLDYKVLASRGYSSPYLPRKRPLTDLIATPSMTNTRVSPVRRRQDQPF